MYLFGKMPDYRQSSVTLMVMPKIRSDETGGILHSSWIINLATFEYLHYHLFLYLNTQIIVPLNSEMRLKIAFGAEMSMVV